MQALVARLDPQYSHGLAFIDIVLVTRRYTGTASARNPGGRPRITGS